MIMEMRPDQLPVSRFFDVDEAAHRSADILNIWSQRCAPDRGFTYRELLERGWFIEPVGRKNFDQWYSHKRISARNPETLGARVFAIVKWYILENANRPVVNPDELAAFIALYPDIPAKNKLQLQRLHFELKLALGGVKLDRYDQRDWRTQFAEWNTFGFVRDQYWCIRACSKYIMELNQMPEEGAKNWYWWHQLSLGDPHAAPTGEHPRSAIRGIYDRQYTFQQMLRFRWSVADAPLDRQRYETLLNLLRQTYAFSERWAQVETAFEQGVRPLTQLPVPFFRSDDTLLWMLEVIAPLEDTDGFTFIGRLSTDAVSTEYLSKLRYEVDRNGPYSRNAFFIEDFAHHFRREERLALGLAE